MEVQYSALPLRDVRRNAVRELTLYETRVIGALIEKKLTTPDQYPLTLNALMNACNQKSNRDPVLDLSETEVQEIVDSLRALNLVGEVTYGNRVPKYQHRFCNTEFNPLHLASPELAIVCCLFLRGPQTPGELRTRTNRLYEFKDLQQVESTLQDLLDRDDGPLVKKLPREPGRRESRFAHLFSGEPEQDYVTGESRATADALSEAPRAPATSDRARIDALEQQVKQMQADIERLKQQWEDLNS